MRHGIKIPRHQQYEMLNFLAEGPEEGQPPAWITWTGENVHVSSSSSDTSSSDSDESSEDSEYRPFLQLTQNPDGRKCRCGSTTHLTIQSHACPQNPRNNINQNNDDDDENNSDTTPAPNDDTNDGVANDNDDDDENNSETTPAPNDNDDNNNNGGDGPTKRRRNDTNTNTIPSSRRPRLVRRTKRQGYKVQEKVYVDFNGEWWPATIIYKHRGKYAVKYDDDKGNVEKQVPHERIQLPEE